MSSITRIMIGEIRVIVSDIVFYKPLYSKNILETILARVNGNNTVLIKFKCREELEEVVNLLDSISIIKNINSDKNAVEDISFNNELDNSSQITGELIKPLPSESTVKKEWDEKPFPKSTKHYESENTLTESEIYSISTLIKDIKENIKRIFKNQHKW